MRVAQTWLKIKKFTAFTKRLHRMRSYQPKWLHSETVFVINCLIFCTFDH